MINLDTYSSQIALPFVSKIMILAGLTMVFMTIGGFVIGIFFFGSPFFIMLNNISEPI